MAPCDILFSLIVSTFVLYDSLWKCLVLTQKTSEIWDLGNHPAGNETVNKFIVTTAGQGQRRYAFFQKKQQTSQKKT